MNMKKQLEDALKDSIRSSDDVRKRTIRLTLADIKLAEIDKKRQLSDPEILAIIQKGVKERQDVIEESTRAQRPDLVASAEAEISVLQGFLPDQLTEQELEQIVQEVIDELGAKSMQDMGSVMKVLIPRLEGRATGQQASQMVRKLLQ